ncbi:PD-(D/E)XK nuclease domain-containing protein [Chloroflexi bacterium TSY]|nr:PD-(D/E)XK nuclease domain-containing protein [Chloroflexi bacterium TSY]
MSKASSRISPLKFFLIKPKPTITASLSRLFLPGQYIECEVNTNDGRLDCVVQSPTHIYILEFKLNQTQ